MNNIGLNIEKTKVLAKDLNDLLANYQILYMNSRGYHWNIKGEKFFELHLKFEELYNNLIIKIDEIAERILTLGAVPLHSYTEYNKISEIKEVENLTDGKVIITQLLKSIEIILKKQRAILHLAAETEDEGTNALMSDYIREQEKLVWMYNAYLK